MELVAALALGLACAAWGLVQRHAARRGARPLPGPCAGSCTHRPPAAPGNPPAHR